MLLIMQAVPSKGKKWLLDFNLLEIQYLNFCGGKNNVFRCFTISSSYLHVYSLHFS